MSLVPLLRWSDLTSSSPTRLFDPFWGTRDDSFFMSPMKMREMMLRAAARPLLNRQNSGITQVSNTAQEYRVSVDVSDFEPDELQVTAGDGCIVIRGEHGDKTDEHGYVSRKFVRRLALPNDVMADDVMCELSANGVLNVVCPKRQQPTVNERVVPIKRIESNKVMETEQKKE